MPLAVNKHYYYYIIHGTKGVTFFYDVLGKFRFVVCELIVSVMFSEPHLERSTSLSNILFVACLARQLIYFIFATKVCWTDWSTFPREIPRTLSRNKPTWETAATSTSLRVYL